MFCVLPTSLINAINNRERQKAGRQADPSGVFVGYEAVFCPVAVPEGAGVGRESRRPERLSGQLLQDRRRFDGHRLHGHRTQDRPQGGSQTDGPAQTAETGTAIQRGVHDRFNIYSRLQNESVSNCKASPAFV